MSATTLAPSGRGPGPRLALKPAVSARQLLTTLLPWAVLAVLYLVLVLRVPNFLKSGPLSVLLYSITILGVVAMGQLCVILIGGIDLSVSATMTLTNVVSAYVIATTSNQHLFQAVVVSLLVGASIGVLNGLVITKLGLPDMIATLAMMTIVSGALLIFRKTHLKVGNSPALADFATKPFFGPVMPAAVVWILLSVVLIVVLRKTTFGRQVYAVGLSRGAAHAAGISVMRTTILLYVISGVCAAAAGVLLTGQLGGMELSSGNPYQLWSIAAVVLGGTSIFGGRGGYGSTIAGVAIIVVLQNGLLNVLGIPTSAQNILYGLVIIAMLVVFRVGGTRDEEGG